MLNLARADLYRLVRSKGTYLCLGSILLIYVISLITNQPIAISMGYETEALSDTTLNKDIVLAACNFNYYFIMLFPVSLLIISDFMAVTVSNTLSSVTSKRKYFIFKFCFTQFLSLVLFLLGNTAYYIVHRISYGASRSTEAGTFFYVILLQIPLFIAMISIFVFFAFLFRRSSVFNTVLISVPVVYSGFIGLLFFIKSTNSFASKYLTKTNFSILFEKVMTMRTDSGFITKVMIGSVAVTLLMFAAGLKYFCKSEAVRQ